MTAWTCTGGGEIFVTLGVWFFNVKVSCFSGWFFWSWRCLSLSFLLSLRMFSMIFSLPMMILSSLMTNLSGSLTFTAFANPNLFPRLSLFAGMTTSSNSPYLRKADNICLALKFSGKLVKKKVVLLASFR